MIFALAALLALAGLGADGRALLRRSRWRQAPSSAWAWVACSILVTLASFPFLLALPHLLGRSAVLAGDASTHAVLAHVTARDGVPHGWVETFNGGFPIAVHYPLLGWLAVAALDKAGMSAATAQNAIATLATLAAPLATLLGARAAGARPLAAVAGALVVAWLSPYQAHEGSWEVYFRVGQVAQTIAWPLAIVLFWSVASRASSRAFAPLAGALLVAAHPQIALGAFAVAGAGALASWNRGALDRVARAAVAGFAVGAAQFVPGVRSLVVPFGWPHAEAWKILGYPPARLVTWIVEGRLLDDGRAPVLSVLWLFASAILVAFVRRKACRIALAATLAGLFLALGGRLYTHLGATGAWLLGFIQPMRALPIVPLTAAVCVVVAMEELLAGAAALEHRVRGGRVLVALVPWFPLAPAAAAALPVRAEAVRTVVAGRHLRDAATGPIDQAEAAEVSAWLAPLDRGRLEFQTDDADADRSNVGGWARTRGVILASPIPLAGSFGVGAHVGVNAVAFSRLRSCDPGSAARAEALGIRFLVHKLAHPPDPTGGGWIVRRSGRSLALSERLGGTDIVGVGCRRSVLSGSNAALHAALLTDPAAADAVADPHALVLLERSSGLASSRALAPDACRVTGAGVEERRREPGAYEANIDAPAPVDVVIRASAVATWRVLVDGAPAPVDVVAPGFPAVRVPAGRHHVEAVVSLPRGYLLGAGLGLMVVVAACCTRPTHLLRRLRASRAWVRGAR